MGQNEIDLMRRLPRETLNILDEYIVGGMIASLFKLRNNTNLDPVSTKVLEDWGVTGAINGFQSFKSHLNEASIVENGLLNLLDPNHP